MHVEGVCMTNADERVTLNLCQGFGCHEHCVVEVHSKDGKISRVQKAPLNGPYPGCKICPKGVMNSKIPYAENRPLYPMKRKGERGSGEWERISWDQAITEITDKMKELMDEYGPHSILVGSFWCGLPGADRSTNYDLAHRFVNATNTTRLELPSVDMCLIYASIIEQGGPASNNKYLLNIADSEIIIWGSNPIGFTRPGETTNMLVSARERGVKLVHISNLYDVTSAKCDEWVPVKSGTDAALALGMANVLVENDLVDKDFLLGRTTAAYLVRDDNGQYLREADIVEGGDPAKFVLVDADTDEIFIVERETGKKASGALGSDSSGDSVGGLIDEGSLDSYGGHTPKLEAVVEVSGIGAKTVYTKLREHLAKWTPESQEALTGVPAATCEKLARDLWDATPAMIFIYDGFRYANGTQSARAVFLLAYLTGNFGNGKGNFLPAPLDYSAPTAMNVMPFWFPQMPEPTQSDQRTLTEIMASFGNPDAPQQFKAYINPFSNPLTNWPNKDLWLNRILPNLELFVCFEIRMSDTAKYADYVLPEATIFERYEYLSGPNDCVILNEPAIDPIGETKDPAEIWKMFADKLGVGEYMFSNMLECAKFKADLMANQGALIEDRETGEVEPLSWERLEKQKFLHFPMPEAPYDNYDGTTFNTKSGKIEFYAAGMVPLGAAFADYQKTIIHDEETLAKYPLHFYPGRHKYFMQSQFTNVPELRKLATATQTGVALNPVTAAERGLEDGDLVEVFNDRGVITCNLHLRQDIPPGMAHMWYSFDEDDYKDKKNPQLIATPLGAPETVDNIIKYTSLGLQKVYDASGVPRSARFIVEKDTPEVFWDTLCEVRKAE